MSEMGFQIPAGALDHEEDRHGRTLTCTRCRLVVRVYEACQGARTEQEHQWIDPALFVCGLCLEPAVTDRGAAADIPPVPTADRSLEMTASESPNGGG